MLGPRQCCVLLANNVASACMGFKFPFLFIQNGRICWELDNIDFSGKGFDAAYRKRDGIGSFQPSLHPLPLRLKLEKRFPDKKNFL